MKWQRELEEEREKEERKAETDYCHAIEVYLDKTMDFFEKKWLVSYVSSQDHYQMFRDIEILVDLLAHEEQINPNFKNWSDHDKQMRKSILTKLGYRECLRCRKLFDPDVENVSRFCSVECREGKPNACCLKCGKEYNTNVEHPCSKP